MKLGIDRFALILLSVVALACLFPCRGSGAKIASGLSSGAISLLFFLHGAKLSRSALAAGLSAWRVHLVVLIATFVFFPLLGLVLLALGHNLVSPLIAMGVVFLCILPSTVQSSIAFTAIARGNVSAAVCSASISTLAGVVLTPVLAQILLGRAGAMNVGGSITAIAAMVLLPFLFGHLSRPFTAAIMVRQRKWVGLVDRGSILLMVYTAFSATMVQGLWRRFAIADLGCVVLIDALLLAASLGVTTLAARHLGFSTQDEIATVFCGSKKSLASGVPMASVLFPAAMIGPIVVPLMLFHQLQLIVCSVLAARYAKASG